MLQTSGCFYYWVPTWVQSQPLVCCFWCKGGQQKYFPGRIRETCEQCYIAPTGTLLPLFAILLSGNRFVHQRHSMGVWDLYGCGPHRSFCVLGANPVYKPMAKNHFQSFWLPRNKKKRLTNTCDRKKPNSSYFDPFWLPGNKKKGPTNTWGITCVSQNKKS